MTITLTIQNPLKHLWWSFSAKIVNGFHKNPSQILDLFFNTPLSILRSKEIGVICLLQFIKLCSSVMKYSPFYQKYIVKIHVYTLLIVRDAISKASETVQKYKIAKKRSLGKISKQCTMISWARTLKSKTFQKW